MLPASPARARGGGGSGGALSPDASAWSSVVDECASSWFSFLMVPVLRMGCSALLPTSKGAIVFRQHGIVSTVTRQSVFEY